MAKGKTKKKVRYFIPEEYSEHDVVQMRVKLKNVNRRRLELLICVLGREIIRLENQLKASVSSVQNLHEVVSCTKCQLSGNEQSNSQSVDIERNSRNETKDRKTRFDSQRILRSHCFSRGNDDTNKNSSTTCIPKNMRLGNSSPNFTTTVNIDERKSCVVLSDVQTSTYKTSLNIEKAGSVSYEHLHHISTTSLNKQSLSCVEFEGTEENNCQQQQDPSQAHSETDESRCEVPGNGMKHPPTKSLGTGPAQTRHSSILQDASFEKILAEQGLVVVEDASKGKLDVFDIHNREIIYHKEDADITKRVCQKAEETGAEQVCCELNSDANEGIIQDRRNQTGCIGWPVDETVGTDENKDQNHSGISKSQIHLHPPINKTTNPSSHKDNACYRKIQSFNMENDSSEDIPTTDNSNVILETNHPCTSPRNSSHSESHCSFSTKDTTKTQGKESSLTFVCPVCKATFHTREKLKKHAMTVHQCDLYPCLRCGRVFNYKNILKIHLKNNHNHQTVLCSYCGKLVLQRRLNTHLEKVHEKPTYTCHICHKGFLKRECLEGHVNRHSNTKPYKCEFCGRKYAYSTSLSGHKKHCVKATMPTHLIHPGNVEEKDKSYICEVCGVKFEGTSGLKDHYNAKHSSKSQVCHFCGKRFKWRPSYNRHVKKCKDRSELERDKCKKLNSRNLTGKQFTCVCGKQYPYRQSFRRHQKTCLRKQDVELTDYLASTLELPATLIG